MLSRDWSDMRPPGSVRDLMDQPVHTAIQRKLDRLGYRGEHRRFTPHMTLGRAGRNAHPRPLVREIAALAEFDAGSMLVNEVTVYASQLASEGPEYRVLSRSQLSS